MAAGATSVVRSADMEKCSVCGQTPAVCVDKEHKGTYWLCGDCVGIGIEDNRDLVARVTELLDDGSITDHKLMKLVYWQGGKDAIQQG